MNQMENEYEISKNIRFVSATMRNEKGEPILCKCGNPAGAGIIGKEAFIPWCSDCNTMTKEYSAKLIYRPPNHEH